MVKVKKLHPDAQIPTRANYHDAGADLYSVESVLITPGDQAFIDTGIAVEASDRVSFMNAEQDWDMHYYFRIAPRSGLAFKNGIMTLAGVVDSRLQSLH